MYWSRSPCQTRTIVAISPTEGRNNRDEGEPWNSNTGLPCGPPSPGALSTTRPWARPTPSPFHQKPGGRAASLPADGHGGLLRAPARMQAVGLEQAVEELNRPRSLSDGRGHALDGTVSNVAGRENPPH